MKLIQEIFEKEILPESTFQASKYGLRRVANAILLNDEGEVGLIYAKMHDFYVFPGGKIEEGESPIEALHREVMEEVGATCEIIGEVGASITYEEKEEKICVAYTFLAKITSEVGERKLTFGEEKSKCETQWLTVDEAISKIEKTNPNEYVGHFLKVREANVLKEYKARF